ncbi:hypothetical protein V2J09_006645 [Rumex salicifolius]
MALVSQSSLAVIPHSKALASDNLRSSSSSITGVPLKAWGKARALGITRREFSVSVKLRKPRRQHQYPWSDNADPNVKGGVLTLLSPFKPLGQQPKPVVLDFEKPLMDLQKKITDVRKMASETGLDFTDQIMLLETKYQQALKDLYLNLTPIQRVTIARHPNRPTFLDHIFNITDKFVELHGDRAGYDDPAIVTGIGTINGKRYMFIGHQKGRNTKENIKRNFGMPTPHGYRKALRMMYYADHHGFPIITFIDTPGAFADIKSEALGQGEAIAHNLRTMFGLKVPIVSLVIGEGGSGGALAIGCANKLLMLENAVFYVASPEACAAILWKTAKASPKAAEKLRITATELTRLQIADGIVPEPLGGAHADPSWTSQQIKKAVLEAMEELEKMDTKELLQHRSNKFRKIGGFQEGLPVEPERKRNMKLKDGPIGQALNEELEREVQKLKEQVLQAKDSSEDMPTLGLDETIAKLRKEVDRELSEALKALGLEERRFALLREIAESRSSQDQFVQLNVDEKAKRFKEELEQRLPTAPNYSSLDKKRNLLKELDKAKSMKETKAKEAAYRQAVDHKYKEILDRPDIKQKFESLKAEIAGSGVSEFKDLDNGLKERILGVKREIQTEVANVLKSLGLDVQIVQSSDNSFIDESLTEVNEELYRTIDETVMSSDLKNKMELLKSLKKKERDSPSADQQKKIQALEQQIKDRILIELRQSEAVTKLAELKSEISEGSKSINYDSAVIG